MRVGRILTLIYSLLDDIRLSHLTHHVYIHTGLSATMTDNPFTAQAMGAAPPYEPVINEKNLISLEHAQLSR